MDWSCWKDSNDVNWICVHRSCPLGIEGFDCSSSNKTPSFCTILSKLKRKPQGERKVLVREKSFRLNSHQREQKEHWSIERVEYPWEHIWNVKNRHQLPHSFTYKGHKGLKLLFETLTYRIRFHLCTIWRNKVDLVRVHNYTPVLSWSSKLGNEEYPRISFEEQNSNLENENEITHKLRDQRLISLGKKRKTFRIGRRDSLRDISAQENFHLTFRQMKAIFLPRSSGIIAITQFETVLLFSPFCIVFNQGCRDSLKRGNYHLWNTVSWPNPSLLIARVKYWQAFNFSRKSFEKKVSEPHLLAHIIILCSEPMSCSLH